MYEFFCGKYKILHCLSKNSVYACIEYICSVYSPLRRHGLS